MSSRVSSLLSLFLSALSLSLSLFARVVDQFLLPQIIFERKGRETWLTRSNKKEGRERANRNHDQDNKRTKDDEREIEREEREKDASEVKWMRRKRRFRLPVKLVPSELKVSVWFWQSPVTTAATTLSPFLPSPSFPFIRWLSRLESERDFFPSFKLVLKLPLSFSVSLSLSCIKCQKVTRKKVVIHNDEHTQIPASSLHNCNRHQ